MITGVIENNRPYVVVTIAGSASVQQVVALIDTGFTGELKVPPEKISELGLKITHVEKVTLADGASVDMQCSVAIVALESGAVSPANVLVSSGEILIGVGLLKKFGYKLTIDFPNNRLELIKVV